ncbi:MAG: HlyC/CorC family transporter [Thermodesulfobacteria bacterium]|nr:HlyC/CorC family transporter [Thermodesulfobacteriota bacterium]
MAETYLILIAILIGFSVLFTAGEASIFSLSRIEVAGLRNLGVSEKVLSILARPEELLIVLIAGNEIVDYFTSLCGSKLFSLWFPLKAKELAFLVFGFLSFWIGDFFPKVAGFKLRTFLAKRIIYIIYVFYYLFYPLRKVYSFIYSGVERLFPNVPQTTTVFSPVEQIILYILEEAYHQKKITEKEKTFIKGLFLSEKIEVSAILTPRSEIVAFKNQKITLEFLEKLKSLPYNKFPVYKDKLDEVLGILYVKDLITNFSPEVLEKKELKDFVRPAFFIPESFKVRDLLFEFQERHTKIALVIDEYGILKGLVTLEDVLEELFGEIYEREEAKIEPIKKLRKNKWLLSGKVLIEELKEVLGIEVVEPELKDVKTLNGFLLALFKEIPKKGDAIVYQGYRFKVKSVKGRRILWVVAEKLLDKKEKKC